MLLKSLLIVLDQKFLFTEIKFAKSSAFLVEKITMILSQLWTSYLETASFMSHFLSPHSHELLFPQL